MSKQMPKKHRRGTKKSLRRICNRLGLPFHNSEKHMEAARTQDPRGCDTGRKIEPVFDQDEG